MFYNVLERNDDNVNDDDNDVLPLVVFSTYSGNGNFQNSSNILQLLLQYIVINIYGMFGY